MSIFDNAKFEHDERVVVSDKVNSYYGQTGIISVRAKDENRNVFMYVMQFDDIPSVPSGHNVFDEWQIEKV